MKQRRGGPAALPAGGDDALRRHLEAAVGAGDVRAAVAVVGSAGQVARRAWAGWGRDAPRRAVSAGARFDLASVTKAFTATLALRLDAAGLLPLATRVREVWTEAEAGIGRKTLEALLRHRGGFDSWAPIYRLCADRREAAGLLVSGRLRRPGREVYGDLGYVLWGLTAERALGDGLLRLFRRHLLRPAGLSAVTASPGARRGVVECDLDTRREVELAAARGHSIGVLPPPAPGQVQDGNARFLGGLAGHAGLFASAEEVWRLAAAWLRPGELLAPAAVERALSGGRRFALAWHRRRLRNGGGPALGRSAFGHPGFTGCSVWIDPGASKIAVLLAHRTAVTVDLDPWRRRFHALALAD